MSETNIPFRFNLQRKAATPPGMRPIVVAIDGPAGAGKSTVTRRLARAVGYSLLDTGALYRAVAYMARTRGIAWHDEAALADVARDMAVAFRFEDDVNHMFIDGQDVTSEIREPEISGGASKVSALPAVRAALLDLQRRIGGEGGVVAEGRDIGTVVFPDAAAKFFLTAAPEVRAQRRCDELIAAGREVAFEPTLAEIRERDERDSNRAVAPLKQADDAILVDSSSMTIDEVVAFMKSHVDAAVS